MVAASSTICTHLQDMDDTAARVRDQLAEVAAKKRELTVGISAADRDVTLWDQRLQQELDMQVIHDNNLPAPIRHRSRCRCHVISMRGQTAGAVLMQASDSPQLSAQHVAAKQVSRTERAGGAEPK